MQAIIIDENETDVLFYEYFIQSHFDDCKIKNYNCPQRFIDDLSRWKTPVPDFILSDYHKGKFNGTSFLRAVEVIKQKNKILDHKLNVFLISSNLRLKKNKDEMPEVLKGFIKKPLKKKDLNTLVRHIKKNLK